MMIEDAGRMKCRGGRIAVAALALMFCVASDAGHTSQGLAEFKQGRFAEAFQEWSSAAEAGDARGALYVGVLYDTGLGVPQDYNQAMAWYRRASDAGSPAGAFNVGVLYDAGIGVGKDPAQAAAWYSLAAKRGFGRAEYNLGMLYETGSGVPQQRDRAIALFRSAFSHGITAAAFHLSELGQRVATAQKSPTETSLQLFELAQHALLDRGAADTARAAALFRQAAQLHNALAEYDLAYCYEHGMGVPRDAAKAYGWYQRAAADASNDTVRSIAVAGVSNIERGLTQAALHASSGNQPPQPEPRQTIQGHAATYEPGIK